MAVCSGRSRRARLRQGLRRFGCTAAGRCPTCIGSRRCPAVRRRSGRPSRRPRRSRPTVRGWLSPVARPINDRPKEWNVLARTPSAASPRAPAACDALLQFGGRVRIERQHQDSIGGDEAALQGVRRTGHHDRGLARARSSDHPDAAVEATTAGLLLRERRLSTPAKKACRDRSSRRRISAFAAAMRARRASSKKASARTSSSVKWLLSATAVLSSVETTAALLRTSASTLSAASNEIQRCSLRCDSRVPRGSLTLGGAYKGGTDLAACHHPAMADLTSRASRRRMPFNQSGGVPLTTRVPRKTPAVTDSRLASASANTSTLPPAVRVRRSKSRPSVQPPRPDQMLPTG